MTESVASDTCYVMTNEKTSGNRVTANTAAFPTVHATHLCRQCAPIDPEVKGY